MRFLTIVKFDFFNLIKNPMLFIINTLFPLVCVGVVGFVTRNSYNGGDISSYDYYGVTMMIYTAIMITMTVSNTFMEKSVKDGNIRIVYSPVKKAEIYLSKILSTYIFATITYSVDILLLQYVFGIKMGGGNILYIICLVNIFMFFSCCVGTMICCVVKSEELANVAIQPYNQIAAILGNLFFPIVGLGVVVEKISYISPVKWVTECAFQIIYDNNHSMFFYVLLMLFAASLLCIGVCQIKFKPEEYV